MHFSGQTSKDKQVAWGEDGKDFHEVACKYHLLFIVLCIASICVNEYFIYINIKSKSMGYIYGKGGSIIKEIQRKTQCRIKSNDDIELEVCSLDFSGSDMSKVNNCIMHNVCTLSITCILIIVLSLLCMNFFYIFYIHRFF